MAFVCYCVALGILGLAYHWPDLSLLVVFLVTTRFALRHF